MMIYYTVDVARVYREPPRIRYCVYYYSTLVATQ